MFSLEHLRVIRMAEVDDVSRLLPPGARVLEIGAGTGEQAAELARRGFDVAAIDLPASTYSANRVSDVIDYDGVNIPFPDRSFDVVFSSNVLEHVVEIDPLEKEIHRVLRPGGRCVHLVPTPAWRLWTALTAFEGAAEAGGRLIGTIAGFGDRNTSYPGRVIAAGKRFAAQTGQAIMQPRHGERGNRLTELHYFSRAWWIRHFDASRFKVIEARPAGLFYTGNMTLGTRLSVASRRRLALRLGSACHLFVLTSKDCAGEGQASDCRARETAQRRTSAATAAP